MPTLVFPGVVLLEKESLGGRASWQIDSTLQRVLRILEGGCRIQCLLSFLDYEINSLLSYKLLLWCAALTRGPKQVRPVILTWNLQYSEPKQTFPLFNSLIFCYSDRKLANILESKFLAGITIICHSSKIQMLGAEAKNPPVYLNSNFDTEDNLKEGTAKAETSRYV